MKKEIKDDDKKGLVDGKNGQEEDIVKFEDGNKKKNNVQVQEIEDENGFQRNVVTDLGNGKKSIQITRFMRRHGKGKNYF